MSTCMTERWIDRVDPYGYARQAGVKTAYVAIVFFLVNAFWKAPTLVVLTMCITGAGIILMELPSINSYKKKDLSYIVFTILTIVTVSIFRFFSYFTVLEVVAIIGWSYVLYKLVATDTEKAQVVAIAILIGFVSLEAPGATDFWAWVDQTAFYVQFAVIAFVAHKLFPNRYMRIVANTMRQIWLAQQAQLDGTKPLNRTSNASVFIEHLSVLEQVKPLLPIAAQDQLPELVDALWRYQHWLDDVICHGDAEQLKKARDTHARLILELSSQGRKSDTATNSDPQSPSGAAIKLSQTWSQLCQQS